MGNVTTYSVKLVDTAATIFSTPVPLGRIVWCAMSDTNVLQIDDADGNEMLYYAKAGGANDHFDFDFNGLSRSLKVTTIGGGKLLIYPYMPTR
jgi:hypothetical protein